MIFLYKFYTSLIYFGVFCHILHQNKQEILLTIQGTVPFRVIATNSAGQSEPSESSDTAIAEARYRKYFCTY